MMKKLLSLAICLLTAVTAGWAQRSHHVPATPQEALKVGEKALTQKKYKLADRMADIALKHDSTARRAAEIKIQSMGGLMETKQDSTKYIIALLELHQKDHSNAIFLSLLMQYFSWPGREHEMRLFAQDEIRRDSNNYMAWLLKGETYMREQAWDQAISDYQKAVDIDSTMTEAYYNIGICYMSKAVTMKEALEKNDTTGKERKLSKEEVDSIKQEFKRSQFYLEKVRTMDSKRQTIDWRMPLYQIYYVLEDKRAVELKKLLKSK